MTRTVTWQGTEAEWDELAEIVGGNCFCGAYQPGVNTWLCAGHAMLLEDQRALDGLVFARRIAGRLRAEEFDPAAVDDLETARGGERTRLHLAQS